MRVIFTSHRVENIPFLRAEFEKSEVIVLEEPRNDVFYDVLSGKISVEEYVRIIDTQFPVYTARLVEMLRSMRDKTILQVEPYLQEVERLRNFGKGDERVREMERKVNLAYVDYAESFLKGDFDEIVSKVIEFAKADAERFVMRDEMRAGAIEVEDAVIEAGVMHTKLAEILDAETISIPELIAERLGVKYLETPGNVLTSSYIHGFDCEEELLAARSLVYISLVEKKEMEPDEAQQFPHFVHEQKIIRFVNRLDYEKCKKIFSRLWMPNL